MLLPIYCVVISIMSEHEKLVVGDSLDFVPWEKDFAEVLDKAEAELGPRAYADSWNNLLTFANYPEQAINYLQDTREYYGDIRETKLFARTIAYDMAYVAISNSPAPTVSEGYFTGEGMKRFRFGMDQENYRIHCSVSDKLPGRPLDLTVDAYLPLGNHVNTSMMNATRHPRKHGEKLQRHFPVGELQGIEAQRGFFICVHELVSTLLEVTPSDINEA